MSKNDFAYSAIGLKRRTARRDSAAVKGEVIVAIDIGHVLSGTSFTSIAIRKQQHIRTTHTDASVATINFSPVTMRDGGRDTYRTRMGGRGGKRDGMRTGKCKQELT